MKSVMTSYYAKIKQLRSKYPDHELISISQVMPKWLESPLKTVDALTPPWSLVRDIKNGEIDWEGYEYRYGLQLLNLSAEDLYNALPEKCILLCYEKSTDNCHRHLVADWLNEFVDGADVKEVEF